MKNLTEKLALLREEKNAASRNAMALELADTGDERVLEELVRLIGRPELVNERGTLVNCLVNFKYERLFEFLVDLQIAGNWEVAHEAHKLLAGIEFVSGQDAEIGYKKISEEIKKGNAEPWRHEQLLKLIEMFE